MKKRFLLLLFSSLIFFSYSQDRDYSILRTDGKYHYSKYEANDSFKYIKTQEITNQTITDSGTYYSAYPYAFEYYQGDEHEYVDANTGSFGDSIFIDNGGNTSIFTAKNKIFYFEQYLHNYQSWIIYTDDDGNYIKGRYDVKTYSAFYPYLPNVIDSIVPLSLFAYDSTNSLIDKKTILVSKSFGCNKMFDFNEIDNISGYSLLTAVGIEREDFNDGFNLKNSYEDVFLSLEIGNEVHVKYEDYYNGHYHYEIRKVIGKEVGDSLVNYTFEYCDSISNADTIVTTEVTKSYYYKMRNRELLLPGLLNDLTSFQDVTDFYIYDWNGKKHFKFYTRVTDELYFDNDRDYWVFWYPDQISNYGTAYYEFIEEIGVIVVDRWDGNYLLDEIHYYKTQTDEWGTPFSHSCSDNTGISETQSTQITLYPNPAEDVIYLKSPLKIDRVNLFDLQGRLVKQFELTSQTSLDVSDLESGVYLIEMLNENKILNRQKLIVK